MMPQDSSPKSGRGGAPVGFLSELGPLEAAAVIYLRLWCSSAQTQARAVSDFEAMLGPDNGSRVAAALAQICQACSIHGRRPLMRHHVDCTCLGGDESCFANFIAAATEGEREDAFLFASNIVRPDIALNLVTTARDFGLGLRMMGDAACVPPEPRSNTLH
ncbi:hypothetical protein [Neptunicoccus cionae]|uniref:hypothetical protein n=1 Tax=Neptunicoccus cionae TaxID=2035344 RepID=UPI00256FF047|nr:hypothetical protein [Amylibacter cionae]